MKTAESTDVKSERPVKLKNLGTQSMKSSTRGMSKSKFGPQKSKFLSVNILDDNESEKKSVKTAKNSTYSQKQRKAPGYLKPTTTTGNKKSKKSTFARLALPDNEEQKEQSVKSGTKESLKQKKMIKFTEKSVSAHQSVFEGSQAASEF